MLKDLKALTASNYLIGLLVFTGLLGPGLIYWYVFNNDSFYKFDVLRLVLMSLAVSAPLYMINLALALMAFEFRSNWSDTRLRASALLAAVASALAVYPPIFLAILYEQSQYELLVKIVLNESGIATGIIFIIVSELFKKRKQATARGVVEVPLETISNNPVKNDGMAKTPIN